MTMAPCRRVEPQFDDGPASHRIGLLTFETDIVIERDFEMMLPRSGEVAFYVARLTNADEVTPENLVAMADTLGDAARRIGRGSHLDVVAYGCTSGTILVGFETIAGKIGEGRKGATVVTPITAAVNAFQKLGMKRVAVLTPYSDGIHTSLIEHLHSCGIEVGDHASYGLETDEAMGRVSPETLFQDACGLRRSEIEGIFISCTSLRAAEIAERLEQSTGLKVVTSTQAFFWDALRSAGYRSPVPGFGQLLRL
jgi:maleate isomerase